MNKDIPSGKRTLAEPTSLEKHLWPWLLLAVMGSTWGLTFSLMKIAVSGGAHPLGISFWLVLIGMVVLFLANAAQKRRISFTPELIKLYLVCAVLGSMAPNILFFYAAAHVSAGVLSITLVVTPLLTYALAALLRVEPIRLGRIAGVVCGGIAVVLLVGPNDSLPDQAAAPWVLVACVASACYAAENLVIALRMPDGASAMMVMCGIFIAASLMLLPIVVITGSYVPLAWPYGPVEWSIISIAMINALTYSLFLYVIKKHGPVFASQSGYIITFAGVGWGILLFSEQHSMWVWAALAVMVTGLVLVSPRK